MSGICGIIRLDGQVVDRQEFQRFFDAMKNRGSDREGIWLEGAAALGHKALWSTPEALHETQPLRSADGRYVLAADARIDNREALFEKLGLNQTPGRGITDADLILLAWEKWQEACPEHLAGDFAFAVYDTTDGSLFFTRDHIGIRTFYYVLTDSLFCFSSEIIPLFEIDGIDKVFVPDMEVKYLQCRYLDYDETFFKGVRRFRPGSYGVLQNGSLRFLRYWFPENIEIDKKISFEEAAEKFRELFTEAVRCRMRSISPIGCELSGGLDSSSVFAVSVELEGKHPVIPVSLHYGDMACDESEYSTLVAEEKGYTLEVIRMDRIEFIKTYSQEQYYNDFPDWPKGGYFMGCFSVAHRLINNGTYILLTGQGGDHLVRGSGFAIADYFRQLQWWRLVRELSYWEGAWGTIKQTILKTHLPHWFIKAYRRFKGSPCIPERLKPYANGSFAFADELGYIVGPLNSYIFDSIAYHDMAAYGMDVRHPFFDKRLVEFSLSLPAHFKLHEGYTKRILRKSFLQALPSKIVMRKDKAEFSSVLEKEYLEYDGKKGLIIKNAKHYNEFTYKKWRFS